MVLGVSSPLPLHGVSIIETDEAITIRTMQRQ